MTAFDDALDALQLAVVALEGADDDGVDRRPVARALEGAFAGIYDALDGRGHGDEALAAAQSEVDTALGELVGAEGALAEAHDRVAEAITALADALPAPPDWQPAPLSASPEVPTIHALARSSLRPHLDVRAPAIAPVNEHPYEPLPPPDTFEALEEHAAAAKAHVRAHLDRAFEARAPQPRAAPDAQPPPEPDPEEAFAQRWAREQAEDVAMVALQRRPLLGDDWREGAPLEARMVRSVDAFAALGEPALATLEAWVLDAPAPAPSRLAAACLLAGSVQGRDTLGLVERLLRAQRGAPDMLEAAREGLVLAPHPQLDPLLRRWCGDGDVELRALAASVLARRDAFDDASLDAVGRDRPEVATWAVLPAAQRGHPVLDELLVRADETAHPELWVAGVLALARRSRGGALERVRGRRGHPRAGMLLAILDDGGHDTEALVDTALATPHPDTIDPLGTVGSAAVVAPLLALVAHDAQPVALAAALALERIGGAGILAEIELDPDLLDEPALPEPDTGGFVPLASRESDPRDPPPEGSPDTIELPAPDPERWTAWWREHRGDFGAGRFRGGRPLDAPAILAELSGPLLPVHLRADTAHELMVATGRRPPFDVLDMVVQQHVALTSWLG